MLCDAVNFTAPAKKNVKMFRKTERTTRERIFTKTEIIEYVSLRV